jgi:hypothetical protein
MKGGRTPIHIMRYAPADFEGDEAVKLVIRRRDYRAYAFYQAFINHSFMAGGDLPDDPERLAVTLGWHLSDVKAALRWWLREGKIVSQNGRLYQKRVQREIAQELEYRELQSARGRRGGRPPGNPDESGGLPPALGAEKPDESPPAPAPAPAPAKTEALSLSPGKSGGEGGAGGEPSGRERRAGERLTPAEREKYAREVWAAWQQRIGGNGEAMSSAEWDTVTRWMDVGVPLRIVLRGIQDCGGQPTPHHTLLYVQPAVNEAFERWRRALAS